MARGINKVILVGNLGNDPEQKSMPSGGAVTNISVATSESWKDQNGQQRAALESWKRQTVTDKSAEWFGLGRHHRHDFAL